MENDNAETIPFRELAIGDTIEVNISDLGFRGEGYSIYEEDTEGRKRFISVRGTLPNERVKIEIETSAEFGNRVYARLISVLKPAPERVDMTCSFFPRCSGCQLRAMRPLAERAFKLNTIAEILTKFTEYSFPEIEYISPDFSREDGFRCRAQYRVVDQKLVFSKQAIPMQQCVAHSTAMTRLIERVELALQEDTQKRVRHVSLAAPVHGHGIVELFTDSLAENLEAVLQKLNKILPPGFGVAINDGESRVPFRGPERFRVPVASLRLEIGYDDWFHTTDRPAELLYDTLIEWIGADLKGNFLDVGCGIGTISFCVANAFENVIGIDVNRFSIKTANENKDSHAFTNVSFLAGGWEKALRQLAMENASFSCISVNPMREPLGERAMQYILKLKSPKLVYLAPSPEAGAKDLEILRGYGFEIKRLAAVNLHPATYHTMMLVLLERS